MQKWEVVLIFEIKKSKIFFKTKICIYIMEVTNLIPGKMGVEVSADCEQLNSMESPRLVYLKSWPTWRSMVSNNELSKPARSP